MVVRTKDARPVSNLGQDLDVNDVVEEYHQYIHADNRLKWKLGIQEGELAGSFSFS